MNFKIPVNLPLTSYFRRPHRIGAGAIGHRLSRAHWRCGAYRDGKLGAVTTLIPWTTTINVGLRQPFVEHLRTTNRRIAPKMKVSSWRQVYLRLNGRLPAIFRL